MRRSGRYGLSRRRYKLNKGWGCIVLIGIVQNLFYGEKRLRKRVMWLGNVDVVHSQFVFPAKAPITPIWRRISILDGLTCEQVCAIQGVTGERQRCFGFTTFWVGKTKLLEKVSRVSSHGTENQRLLLHELLVWDSILLRMWCQGNMEDCTFADFSWRQSGMYVRKEGLYSGMI
jgi:hypothetical protein